MTTVIDLMIVVIVFTWCLWVITNHYGDRWVQYLVNAMFIVLGIFLVSWGIGDVNNWLTRSIGFIHLGVGLIGVLGSAFSDFGGTKNENDF